MRLSCIDKMVKSEFHGHLKKPKMGEKESQHDQIIQKRETNKLKTSRAENE